MGLFKSRYETVLDGIVNKMDMNMSNNYKDNAQADLKDLMETFAEYKERGVLKEKAVKKYEDIIAGYETRLKGFTHKDQKPYWT